MTHKRQRIDWEKVKSRLRKSQRALEGALTASAERREAVYQERAAQLRDSDTAGKTDGLRVLVFTLAGERHAIDFRDLVELLPFSRCTPVPGGPPQLLGVINVHGEIRSVIDLGQLLELPAQGEAGYVLLVRWQGRETAFRVDGLEAVRVVSSGEIAAPADEARPAYLRGITPDRLRVLDTAALLSHPVFQFGPHNGDPLP